MKRTVVGLVAVLAMALTAGCGGATEAAPPATKTTTPYTPSTNDTTVPLETKTIEPEPTPEPTTAVRNEALFLADLSGWTDVDSATKLAFGNVLCDGLAAGLSPEQAVEPIKYRVGGMGVGFPEALGRATRDLCPNEVPN